MVSEVYPLLSADGGRDETALGAAAGASQLTLTLRAWHSEHRTADTGTVGRPSVRTGDERALAGPTPKALEHCTSAT